MSAVIAQIPRESGDFCFYADANGENTENANLGLRLSFTQSGSDHFQIAGTTGVYLAFSPMLLFAITLVYVCISILIAYVANRQRRDSNDYLNATRALPTWIASISFLACNCGALDVLGLSGIALRYGVQAFHFYWIGAIPALIFLALVMIPAYVGSGARSLPEYLGKRFGPKVRLLNAVAILVSTALYTGISLYALAEVAYRALNMPFILSTLVFGSVVLAYVLTGGFRATVYNEVLQFLFMFAGLLPLLYFTYTANGASVVTAGQYWHLWSMTPPISSHAQVDTVGIVVGLGGVVGFSYWCMDYGLIQRALTARNLEAARRVPLLAGFGKIFFGIVVVVPVIMMSGPLHHRLGTSLDETTPLLIATLYGPRLLGIGLTALIAGLLNNLAANVSAFSSLWTGEIYRPFLSSDKTESHYRYVGRGASVCCVAIGISVAFWTRSFENLSAFVLLIFALFVAPFFAVLLTGLFSKQTTTRSAIGGAVAGILVGAGSQLAFAKRWLPSGSKLSANFYAAIFSFAASALVCNAEQLLSLATNLLHPSQQVRVPRQRQPKISMTVWCLAVTLAAVCVVANLFWW